jgi:FkbM family methyltransferase
MFVTYAQNYEDVLLWRALGHVEHGFYIDVGACEPEADSVTKVFYDRGWSGINIEPMPASFARLVEARPRDVNLPIALEDRAGEKNYFAVDGGNGMSSGDQLVRDKLAGEGWAIEEIPTVVRTLADVCAEHVRGEIHFLKIDVELQEHLVIAGGDWNTYRPWVVMGEVHSSQLRDGEPPHWGPMLRSADYVFATYDGLNAVYVAREHEDLLPKLRMPPNFHDQFVTVREEALQRVAGIVGLDATAQPAEIVERVNGLYRDRIRFELEAISLRG